MAITRLRNSSISTGIKYDSILAENVPVDNNFWMLTDDISGLNSEMIEGVSCQTDGKIYCCVTSLSPGAIGVTSYDSLGNRSFLSYLSNKTIQQERRRKFFVDSSQNMALATGSFDTNQYSVTTYYPNVIQYNKNGSLLANNKTTVGDSGGNQFYVNSVVKDANNNLYYNYLLTGGSNPVLLKVNSSYSQVWTKQYSFYGAASDIDTTSGFIYTSGFRNFGQGYNSGFVIKLNLDGDVAWAARYTDPQFSANFYSIKVSPNGFIYAAGNGVVDGAGTPGIICKINPSNGSLVWARYINGSNGGFVNDMSIDSQENVYICGSYGTNQPTSFLIRLNSNGDIDWQNRFSTDGTHMTTLSLDPYNRFVVVGGRSPANKLFLAKLPTNGSKTGTYTVGGESIAYLSASFSSQSLSYSSATVSSPTVSSGSNLSFTYIGGPTTPSVTQAKTTI